MHNEFKIKIGSREHRIFLQDGFHFTTPRPTPLHKHNYAEIHLISNGEVEFSIGNRRHSSANGNLIIIPPNVFHRTFNESPDLRHTAFQIDFPVKELIVCDINTQTALDFMEEVDKSEANGNYAVVAAYISLFCARLLPEEVEVTPITDYSFLISELFSVCYNNDLQLEDLARELHLSQRQAGRLVVKATGNTFKKELTARRITVAKYLAATTDLSLDEIARYVGYRSYTGFWKAMNKHLKENEEE